jgi:hypothetical protein
MSCNVVIQGIEKDAAMQIQKLLNAVAPELVVLIVEDTKKV